MHTFRRVFRPRDEPVKSVKMKVETGSGYFRDSHMTLSCAAYNFGLLSGSLLCFIGSPPQKTLNPTNVRFRLKARGLLYPKPSCRAAETF